MFCFELVLFLAVYFQTVILTVPGLFARRSQLFSYIELSGKLNSPTGFSGVSLHLACHDLYRVRSRHWFASIYLNGNTDQNSQFGIVFNHCVLKFGGEDTFRLKMEYKGRNARWFWDRLFQCYCPSLSLSLSPPPSVFIVYSSWEAIISSDQRWISREELETHKRLKRTLLIGQDKMRDFSRKSSFSKLRTPPK